jgi:hypothetical protein
VGGLVISIQQIVKRLTDFKIVYIILLADNAVKKGMLHGFWLLEVLLRI